MDRHKIIVSFIYPPIPDRSHDWIAYFDGMEENGPKGYGPTAEGALRDMIDNWEFPE